MPPPTPLATEPALRTEAGFEETVEALCIPQILEPEEFEGDSGGEVSDELRLELGGRGAIGIESLDKVEEKDTIGGDSRKAEGGGGPNGGPGLAKGTALEGGKMV